MTSAAKRDEIDANYDAFQRRLGEYLKTNPGEYAVMRDREVVAFYKTPGEAYRTAAQSFPDGIFSIQEATDEPIDLGFFSHVAH